MWWNLSPLLSAVPPPLRVFYSLFASATCFPLGVGAGGLELAGTTVAQIDMVVGCPRGMLVAGVLASAPIA